MKKNIIGIEQLGKEACWMFIQQVIGMPDVKMNSNFFSDKVAMLFFARHSMPERLCCTAAVRQMGGTTIFEGSVKEEWQKKEAHFQGTLLPIFGYYLDCMYIYGLQLDPEQIESHDLSFPIINAGGNDKHPAHALADYACMIKIAKRLDGITAAWIGSPNGTLYSLLELMQWYPYQFNISMPPHVNTDIVDQKIKKLNLPVTICQTPEEAIKDAQFIFAGKRAPEDDKASEPWRISADLIRIANKKVKLLLSASPIRAIPIEDKVLNSSTSLLTKQAEYRLAVHKRFLHWVFVK